jgi:hypothetical protein
VVDDEILFTKSTNNGADFSNPINLSNNPYSFSARPQVAASGRDVYVAWFESGVNHSLNIANTYLARSTDAGITFSSPIRLSNNGPANNYYNFTSDTPKIGLSNIANDDNVYVIWTYVSSSPSSTPQNTDVFFSRSTDAGVTFSPPFNISNNPGLSGDANMIVSTNPSNNADQVNVMWLDDTGGISGERNIFFSQSTDNGTSFGKPINISNTQGSALLSQMAMSGNNLYLTWAEFNSGSYAILFRVVSLS